MADSCSLQYRAAFDAINSLGDKLIELAEPLLREDVEAVHDARVASRRLRAALSEYKKVFDKHNFETLRDKVRRVTSDLGTARELDVCIEHIEKLKIKASARPAAKHAAKGLAEKRAAESPKIAEAAAMIASDEFRQSLAAMKPLHKKTSRCFFKTASRGALKRFDAVDKAAKAWMQSDLPQDLHALRIAFKKFRYACELYRPVYGSHMDELITSLKDIQDSIGHWHDYSVLNDYVREIHNAAPVSLAKSYEALEAHLGEILQSSLGLFRRHAEVFFYPDQMLRFSRFLSGKDMLLYEVSSDEKLEEV